MLNSLLALPLIIGCDRQRLSPLTVRASSALACGFSVMVDDCRELSTGALPSEMARHPVALLLSALRGGTVYAGRRQRAWVLGPAIDASPRSRHNPQSRVHGGARSADDPGPDHQLNPIRYLGNVAPACCDLGSCATYVLISSAPARRALRFQTKGQALFP